MAFPSIDDVSRIETPEREHLRGADEALRDVVLASAITAAANDLDETLIAEATVTMLLTLAAREFTKTRGGGARHDDFARLCHGALEWALRRDGGRSGPAH